MSYGRGRRPRSGVSDAAAKDDIQIPGKIPYIVIIIDELADLMQTVSADVERCDRASHADMSRRAKRSRPTGMNRLQRAPPQPFRARVARNFQPASNQVFCESSPHSRPGAPAR